MRQVFELLQTRVQTYGWARLIQLSLHPLTALATTPVRLAQALWASRQLADGRWGDYPHFSALKGLNFLFYSTSAINLYRYGRTGNSPCLGLGSHALSWCFHFALPSLYAQWIAGAMVPLAGMFGWWIMHAAWSVQVGWGWTVAVMGLALISTGFYAQAFYLQNYNVLGWLFFPLALFGMMTHQGFVAVAGWLGASFGSFTVVVLAVPLSGLYALVQWDLLPVLCVLPALLKTASHFWPFAVSRDTVRTLRGVLKAIGLHRQSAKYKRAARGQIGVPFFFHLFLYGLFAVSAWLACEEPPILFMGGMMLYMLNATVARFADVQSTLLLMMSLASAVTMESQQPWLLLPYWLLLSPPACMLGFPWGRGVLAVVPRVRPFSVAALAKDMETFMSPIRAHERVLMAFADPGASYERVFDGYRRLLELPCYVATKREIHFMPDWWAVFEVNFPGAPDFWGREPEDVLRNIAQWKADYAVVYQPAGTELDAKWACAGFQVLSSFSWKDHEQVLRGEPVFSGPTPQWWLLRPPGCRRLEHDLQTFSRS